jgi:hypothetical protein
MTRMRRRATAALALVLCAGAPPAHAESLKAQVQRLEREIDELKAEMRRRDAEVRRAAPAAAPNAAAAAPSGVAAPPTGAATAGTPPPTGVAAAATAAAAAARPPSAPLPTVAGPTPAEEPTTVAGGESSVPRRALEAVVDRVKVGGYGSFRYEGNDLSNSSQTFTYRRFVLTADANIAARLRGYFELEFERFRELGVEKTLMPQDGGLAAEQAIEATNNSEISIEQAWLQYDLWRQWLSFRGGAVLVPLGRFNLEHDDNRWDLPRRSLVDRGVPVLPSTAAWDEVGLGFLGDVPVGDQGLVRWQTYVVNGVTLDSEFEHIAQTRFPDTTRSATEVKLSPSTGTFGNDVKNGKAWTGRVAVSPWLAHEVAGSWYWGQYTPDFLSAEDVWSLAGDWKSSWGPFELEGEYVYTHWDNIKEVATSLARTARQSESALENGEFESEIEFELSGLANTKQGYWLESRYRFWPRVLSDTFLGKGFANPQLVAVLRGEQVWLHDLVDQIEFSGARLTDYQASNRFVNRITAGLAYRPVPLVVFQLAYEFTWTNGGQSLAGVTNFIPAGPHEDRMNAVLVGAAFGF